MSTPILPLAVWQSGTNENSIPANDNALRIEILEGLVISDAVTAQPSSPADGDVYIIPSAATGSQWTTFDPDDLAIYKGGTWLAYAPREGVVVNVGGQLKEWGGSGGWSDIGGGTGAIVWGAITGTLSSQSDLQTALNAKANTSSLAAVATSGDVDDLTGFPGGTTIFLRGDGTFATPPGGGGGGSPAGSDTQVQFNDAGSFGADATFVFNKTTKALYANLMESAKGSDIARAATTDIWSATGNFAHLTGTTTITSFGANIAGQWRLVRFAGAGTLTHNATSLILPTGANITTAANDTAMVVGEGSSNARVVAYQRANGQALAAAAATVTGWTPSTNTASPNNTVNAARMLVNTTSANGDAVIQPKGTGAFILALPDASAAGGDKRGNYAVDLQLQRSSAAEVASGIGSLVVGAGNMGAGSYSGTGGQNNMCSGHYSWTFGLANSVGGDYAGCFGRDHTISGTGAIAWGESCVSSGAYGVAAGLHASTRSIYGMRAYANGSMAGVDGDSQEENFLLRISTSDATPTRLTTNISAAGTNNQLVLPDNSSFMVRGDVIARSSTGVTKSWEVRATLKRGSGAGTTAIVGSAVVTVADAEAGASTWTLAVTADTTNGCLAVTGTGQAATSIKWNARITSVELVG